VKTALRNTLRSPYMILLLAVLAANWQLVFLQSGLEWDMMNFWMPWRYYMSECYNNGIVPLWDPYTQSGYPVHGDLQGPAYSPEAILVSFLFGQNIYVLNYSFVFYLFVAAVGMYKLAHFFTCKKEVSILAGIIYSTSGFNVAHGHYFYIIVSMALIPFIFYYFFKILDKGTYAHSLKFSLLIFWHITTGNPSFLIISAYLMLAVFIFYLAWKIKSGLGPDILPAVKRLAAVFILSLLMALPVIYNAMQIIPLTTRKDGLDLAYAGDESFYFQNFMAFVTPLITIPNKDIQGLWSCYIGSFTLLFFLAGLGLKKSFYEWSLLFIGVAGLLISFGLQTPVYPMMHKYLPLFNVFRMPNLSVLFFLIAMIVLAAKYLSDPARVSWLFSTRIIWIFTAAWLVLFVLLIYLYRIPGQPLLAGLLENFAGTRQWINLATPLKFILVHLFFFLALVLLLVILKFSLKNKLRVLALVCVFDVMANYQVGAIARIFSAEKASDMNAYFKRFPNNFPVPAAMATERVSAVSNGWPGYWLNTSVFNKQPDFPNSNNFELVNYLDLLLNYPRLSKNIFKNQHAFFADSLVSENGFTDSLLASSKSVVTLAEQDAGKLRQRVFSNEKNAFTCTRFMPNQFAFKVKNEAAVIFVISQNYCPLWRFKLNGQPYKPIAAYRNSFPAFLLPAGEWQVEVSYELPGFDALLLFSLALFVLIACLAFSGSTNNKKLKMTWFISIALLFAYCLVRFWCADPQLKKEKVSKEFSEFASKNPDALLINNSSCFAGRPLNLICNNDLVRLYEWIDSAHTSRVALLNYDHLFPKEAEDLLCAMRGDHLEKHRFSDGAYALLFEKKKNAPITDTTLKPGSIINHANAYSPGILSDSLVSLKYQPGDVLVITTEITANAFDFPGLALEIHFKDKAKNTVYRYSNIPLIKGSRTEKAGIIYKLTPEDTGIEKILCYAWNPSSVDAQVHAISLRAYRP